MRIVLSALFAAIIIPSIQAQDAAGGAHYLEKAKNAYSAEKFADALVALDQFDKLKGATADSLDVRGAVLMEQGKLDGAITDFRAAREKDSRLLAPQLHLAEAFFRQKKYGEARAIFQALAQETNILIAHEKVRYAILLTHLGEHNLEEARSALSQIQFPTETPAYYYAQAAWEFAQGNTGDARKWLHTADQIFDCSNIGWFAQPLYDLGWIKQKPGLSAL